RGDAEEVRDDGKEGETWYLPHHSVFHPKKVDKLRVVFNCSARLSAFLGESGDLKQPPGVNQFVTKNFYVDDGVTSVENVEEAIQVV
ncbi:hypothetical protein QQF64_019979, partial [Cirrhinus molitorella]